MRGLAIAGVAATALATALRFCPREPAPDRCPGGCCVADARSPDGSLVLLTMSLHHRADGDHGPLTHEDVVTLVAEVAKFWPDPRNFVILLTNVPDRTIESNFELMVAELRRHYGSQVWGYQVPVSIPYQGRMGIIAVGPEWRVGPKSGKGLFPDWVKYNDFPGETPCGVSSDHFGVFDLYRTDEPDFLVRIYNTYLCSPSAHDGDSKSKMLSYVMNVALDEMRERPANNAALGAPSVAPILTGDFNLVAQPASDDPYEQPYFVDMAADEFERRVNGWLSLSLQQEIRNRTEWLTDLNASKCTGEDFSSFSCQDGLIHVAQLRDTTLPMLRPVFHAYSATATCDGHGETSLHFSTISHRAALTIFDRPQPGYPPPRPSYAYAMDVSAIGDGATHDCGALSTDGKGWSSGSQHDCWHVRAAIPPSGLEWRPYRVAVRGTALTPAAIEVEALGEQRVYTKHTGPVISESRRMGVTLLNREILAQGAFCKSMTFSALGQRPLELRARSKEGSAQFEWLQIRDIHAPDPCAGSPPSVPVCNDPDRPVLCNNRCIQTSTEASCGACNKACGSGQKCIAGRCECPMDKSLLCGDRCVTPGSTSNCEGCDGCDFEGAVCDNGACVCGLDPSVGACRKDVRITFEDIDDEAYVWAGPPTKIDDAVCGARLSQGARGSASCSLTAAAQGHAQRFTIKFLNSGCLNSGGHVEIKSDGVTQWTGDKAHVVRHCNWFYRAEVDVNFDDGSVTEVRVDPCLTDGSCPN